MLFGNLHAHLGPQVDVVKPTLAKVTSQPIVEDAFVMVSTSSTPREITTLIAFAPTGVSEERIQEMLHLQQASREETMEKRFLFERMETNPVIENTLEALLKSINDYVLFNMNMLMQ